MDKVMVFAFPLSQFEPDSSTVVWYENPKLEFLMGRVIKSEKGIKVEYVEGKNAWRI